MAATQISVINSGLVVDKRSFKWKIDNFDVVRKSPGLVAAQKFQFSAGESIGLPTTWSCNLYQSWKDKSIGFFFNLLDKPDDANEVNATLDVIIQGTPPDDIGKDVYQAMGLGDLKNMADKSEWGFNKLIPGSVNLEELPLVDGSLVIGIAFTLYAAKEHPVSVDVIGKLETFKTKSFEQLSRDQSQFETLTTPSANFVTKIFSQDNVEFPANRGILAARSPVFQRMFETRMSEAETGEVRIDDLSGKTINVLLHYIYAGTLHEDWKSPEVIEELTSAAHRYELGLLTEFLDDVLGSVCTMENAKRLLILAKKLGMTKAEVELFAYLKRNAASVEDITVLLESTL